MSLVLSEKALFLLLLVCTRKFLCSYCLQSSDSSLAYVLDSSLQDLVRTVALVVKLDELILLTGTILLICVLSWMIFCSMII